MGARNIKARIYDTALLPLTAQWYQAVLVRLPKGAKLLDVGIGTAGALCKNAELVKGNNLHVLGIDIDEAYVQRATRQVEKHGLSDRVEVRHQSVYDCTDQPFDAVYFSASFMLLPDPEAALKQVMKQLGPNGKVFFTQTFQERRSPLLEKAKPLLKKITTIDFGAVTYEDDFRARVESAGLVIEEMVELGKHGSRSYRMVKGYPAE